MNADKKLGFLGFTASFIAVLINSFFVFIFWSFWKPSGTPEVIPIYHSVAIILGTGFAVFSLFSYIINLGLSEVASVSVFVLMALLGHLELATLLLPLTPIWLFAISWAINMMIANFAISKLIESYNITSSITKISLIVIMSITFGWGLIGLISSQWISLTAMADQTIYFRDYMLCLGVILPLMITTFVRQFRIDPTSMTKSLKLRLQLSQRNKKQLPIQLGILICFFVCFLRFFQLFLDTKNVLFQAMDIILVYHPIFYFLAYHSVRDIISATRTMQNSNFASKLLNEAALKFLFRLEKNEDTWAAIMGFQSASYLIDHDPQELLQTGLPATLRQIRTEEIQRCINHMLKSSNLHLLELGHNFHGAIDPETSMRPCLDLLRLFSCLYLDASPMVERRIKGLTALIPVVDPILSSRLLNDELSALLKKNYWFFFVDFGWIDQRITKSQRNLRYDISMGTHSAYKIMASIRKQDRFSHFGNCIWITPDSRTRIIQEASLLSNIIEPCPMMIDESKQEELYFILRFEQLIPRLQRYFDLDSMRQEIIDFEPSPEGAQFLNLFNLQVEKASKKEEMMLILKTIQSVPWRGFKEKDGALRLVIGVYEKLKLLAQHNPQIQLEEVHRNIYSTIQKIGYPSQVFHMAQISKFTLREMNKLIHTARNPLDPRFAEAWLVLATQSYPTADQRNVMIAFITEIPKSKGLSELKLVQMKIPEIICNLGKSHFESGDEALKKLILLVMDWYIDIDASTDLMCYLLDTLHFLEHQLHLKITLSPADRIRLNQHIDNLVSRNGESHHKLVALQSRR